MNDQGSPRTEAAALFRMVAIGSMTVVDVRELIDVSPRVRQALTAALAEGMACWIVSQPLDFRAETRTYFDAMVRKAGL